MVPLCEMFGVCFLLTWFIGGFVSIWMLRKYALDKNDKIPKFDIFMGHMVAFLLSWLYVIIILNEEYYPGDGDEDNGVF